MRKIYVLLVVAVLTIMACKKHELIADKYVTFKYSQTYCSDAWTTGTTDSITLKNVANYLNSSNLYIASLGINQDASPDLCKSCFCKTGKTIYVTTLDSDSLKARYLRIGFHY